MDKEAYWRGLPGHRLSARQIEIIAAASRGLSNRQIGKELALSEDTVKTHLRRSFRQAGARDRAHLVAICMSKGLIPIVEAPEPGAVPPHWLEAA